MKRKREEEVGRIKKREEEEDEEKEDERKEAEEEEEGGRRGRRRRKRREEEEEQQQRGGYPAVDGVGGRQHGAARVEARVDAGLGDGDAALLHHLVDGGAVHVGHLVELVDAHHAAVGQHHGARLQAALAWGGRQTQRVSAQARADAGEEERVVPVSWSVVTAAVRPTPVEPRPVVGMARGAVWST